MEKVMRVCVCLAAFTLCMSPAVYGKAVAAVSGNGHVFAYNHAGTTDWNTINDWIKVGDPNHSNYFTLTSETDVAADSITDPAISPSHELRCDLEIFADAPGGQGNPYFVPYDNWPGGTWCGYKWTVPAEYPDEYITKFKVAGFWNIAHIFADLLLLDDANNVVANLVDGWGDTQTGWLNGNYAQQWLLPGNGSKSVSIVLHWRGGVEPANVWAGNYVWLYLMEMTTATGPICGDTQHAKPVGDLSGDCKVDIDDLRMLAANWLTDTRP